MQKDVIYIDVEDDITAIIGKIKAAEHKIVALVPPKRIGAIQSAVNLKLVHRAAEQADKRLVIISNNAALMALAGSAGIPVSKNLQSKPELAEIPALDVDDEDVIDGADLPVGEHVATAEKSVDDALSPAVGAAAVAATEGTAKNTPVRSKAPLAAAAANKVKVPNFDTFRKKLFLIGVAVFLFVGLLVWALVFAPSARVIITARTTDAALSSKVTLGDSLSTDLKAGSIKSLTKSLKKNVSIPFTATGKKDVGEKASGTVTYTNADFDSVTIPAGTTLTSANSGLRYVTTSSVTVPKGSCSNVFNCTPGTASGSVVAAESGTKYNSDSGSLSGAGVSATFAGATSGGTTREVTVVSQEDVDKVSGDVATADASEAAKKELVAQFGAEYVILDATFKADKGEVKPSPAVDAEATDGKGTLSGTVSYSLTAVAKSEANKYLDSYFAQQIDGRSNQKIYSNGIKDVSFTNVGATEKGFSANIATNGKIGPKIDEKALKEYAKGKRYGEIQTYIQQVDGVDSVDVKFAPFWVSKAPNDINKIKIEFKVNGA